MADWPYNTAQWKRLRLQKLDANPLCEYEGSRCTRAATQVDHRKAIKAGGEPWDWDNLASTCATCHTDKTNAEDGGAFKGIRHGVDPLTGLPLDPDHWWSAGKKSVRAAPRRPAPTAKKELH